MKRIFFKIIPKTLLIWRMVYLTFGADIKRYLKSLNYDLKGEDKYIGLIIMVYHVIEKGLTMPNTKLGFGERAIYDLCKLLGEYRVKGYYIENSEIKNAVMVLNEYLSYHEEHNFQLKPEIISLIQITAKEMKCEGCLKQLHFTREEFIKYTNSSFSEFSQSRHTVRNYSKEKIPLEHLISAIKIAQNAPSSCNRQPVRVYIITSPELIRRILELQGGSRGFGDLATALLVITSNISLFQDVMERWQPSVNAGFFGMALLYALHHKNIGACTLNWSEDKRKDNALRKIINIPYNEQINFFISCGLLPNEFDTAASTRRDVHEIVKIFS